MKKLIVTFLFLYCCAIAWSQETLATTEKTPILVTFSVQGGFYEKAIKLELSAPAGATIYYTTDGRAPLRKVKKYKQAINVRTSMCIRAVAYLEQERGAENGQTYLIDEHQSELPTVALAVHPSKLFDQEHGLFMEGSNVEDSTIYKRGANFWDKSEIVAHCQIFETDGSIVHNSNIGMRLFGGFSRAFPQKSLALIAREQYGDKRIEHQLLGKGSKKKYKYLVLRNSGSDYGKSHFRDALMGQLVKKWDLDSQDYRPAQVFINGEYWGIFNMREKVNRHFIAQHHDVDKDSIDLMEHKMVERYGSKEHYVQLLDFLARGSLADARDFAYAEGAMDVMNFMDYQIAQIYCDNQDAGGNIKYWRPQRPGGRWRWILYDTDWGFGLHDAKAYRNNSLDFHTEPHGPKWPNPPWSTRILRTLLENKAFERQFVNRFMDYLNTDFSSENALKKIKKIEANIAHDLPYHLQRWGLKRSKQRQQAAIVRTFVQERPAYIRKFLKERFALTDTVRVRLSASHGGKLLLNDNIKVRGSFEGLYFKNIPIRVEAVPDFGYRFSHWEGLTIQGDWRELNLALDQDPIKLRAVFEAYAHPLIDQLVINEVSAANKNTSDWVEIFNNSKHRLPLRDWVIADKKHKFRLPNVTIAPNDYLVICQDSSKFMKVFPESYNVISGLDFGLNKLGEDIKLFADDGAMVDSMSYQLEPHDTTFTLSLLLPNYDNAQITNWYRRDGIGTPNAPNPYYVESNIRLQQERWIQVGMLASVALFGLLILVMYYRYSASLQQFDVKREELN